MLFGAQADNIDNQIALPQVNLIVAMRQSARLGSTTLQGLSQGAKS